MARYALRRMSYAVVVMFLVSIVVFMLSRVSGDPVLLMLGEHATPEAVTALRAELGLDRPLVVQYLVFVSNVLRGDLGRSLLFNQPTVQVIRDPLFHSVVLAGAALALTVAVGMPLGILGAARHRRAADYVSSAAASVLQGMPVFWFGLLLITQFSVERRWFPSSGYGGLSHLVLPALTLAAYPTARVSRLLRASLLEVLDLDYVRTARAKGLSERIVIVRHALRNAAIPLLTLVGLQVSAMIGGAVITESVVAWPGLGKLILDAVLARDYPLVQACVLLIALIVITVNLATDLLYGAIDPRIAYS